jgi:Ran GTPase-activating protein (RanGAP) involved in mRNA processing and transport
MIAEFIYQHPSIRVLSLSDNSVIDAGCLSFTNLLLQSNRIVVFDLTSNWIGELGASTIFQAAVHSKSIFSLRLGSTSAVGRNSFGADAIQDIEMMFAQNRVLAELDLLMSEIHPEQVDVFAPGLRQNHSLHVLTLANNDVQTRGLAMILQACIDTQLRELNLSGNHLQDKPSKMQFTALCQLAAVSRVTRTRQLTM